MGGAEGVWGAFVGRGQAVQRVLGRLAERWRARAASAGPRLRRCKLPAIRAPLEAELAARLAVRSGVRLEDFLEYRLARYAVRLPLPLEALPIELGFEDGEVVVRARPARRQAGPASGPAGINEQPPKSTPGTRHGRDLRLLEAALDDISGRIAASRDRVEAIGRAIADDLTSGALPGDPSAVEATPEQLGRPPVPPAASAVVLRGLAVALLVSEAFRLAGPALAAEGLSILDLAGAAARAPVATALCLAFALGAAAAVFAFVRGAVERGEDLVRDAPAPRRRAFLTAAGGGAAALAAAVAAAASAPGGWAEQVLLVAVPLAALLLLREGDRFAAARDGAVSAALAWDRARAREAAERARRAEALTHAQATLSKLEAERREVLRQLRALERRAAQDARDAEASAAAEARRLERLAEAFAAALELDRYAYLRRASARAQEVPRPARAGRAARLEPAVATERLGVAG